jgi:hypothetical protein
VNQVISKRMVKRQQMRTRVLNEDLHGAFRRCYSAFAPPTTLAAVQAA